MLTLQDCFSIFNDFKQHFKVNKGGKFQHPLPRRYVLLVSLSLSTSLTSLSSRQWYRHSKCLLSQKRNSTITVRNFLHLHCFLASPYGLQDLQFPNQGMNPDPQQWKHEGLTTGPPGHSLSIYTFNLHLFQLDSIFNFKKIT